MDVDLAINLNNEAYMLLTSGEFKPSDDFFFHEKFLIITAERKHLFNGEVKTSRERIPAMLTSKKRYEENLADYKDYLRGENK